MGERLEGKRCGGCAWFEIVEVETGKGKCRRYAPLPEAYDEYPVWPSVRRGTDWCGEWQDGHR